MRSPPGEKRKSAWWNGDNGLNRKNWEFEKKRRKEGSSDWKRKRRLFSFPSSSGSHLGLLSRGRSGGGGGVARITARLTPRGLPQGGRRGEGGKCPRLAEEKSQGKNTRESRRRRRRSRVDIGSFSLSEGRREKEKYCRSHQKNVHSSVYFFTAFFVFLRPSPRSPAEVEADCPLRPLPRSPLSSTTPASSPGSSAPSPPSSWSP